MRQVAPKSRRYVCERCSLRGKEVWFKLEEKMHAHQQQHANCLINFWCECGEMVVDNDQDILLHREEMSHRRWVDAQLRAQDETRVIRRGHALPSQCPLCGIDFPLRSASFLEQHIQTCGGVPPLDQFQRDDDDYNDGDHGMDDPLSPDNNNSNGSDAVAISPRVYGPLPPPPPWENNLFVSVAPPNTLSVKRGDAILLEGLLVSGHFLAHRELDTIYRVLNNPIFKEAYMQGDISSSYRQARNVDRSSFNARWTKVSGAQGTFFFCRNLLDVFGEMMSDAAVVENLDFEGEMFEVEGFPFCWGASRAAFPVSKAIQERVRHGGNDDVHCIE